MSIPIAIYRNKDLIFDAKDIQEAARKMPAVFG